MPGRTTSDPKPNNIKVRINDDMFQYVVESAKKFDMTVSEYMRHIIWKDMANKSTGKE